MLLYVREEQSRCGGGGVCGCIIGGLDFVPPLFSPPFLLKHPNLFLDPSPFQLVMVDGVGYPAVGSIVGVSNADLAQALGPSTPVLLVGRPGVGDAVDSFNLNATFFRHRGLRVLGVVFNRLPLEGFYALEHCKEVWRVACHVVSCILCLSVCTVFVCH